MDCRVAAGRVWIGLVIVLALARAAEAGAVSISWADNAVDEDGFHVERRAESGGPFELVAVTGANVVVHLDTSVPALGRYCYRVRAFNAAGPSAYTNVSCATAVATTPHVTVTLNGTSFRQRDTMVATVHARAGIVAPVDVYVVVQAGGAMLSLQLDGRLVPGLVPLVRGIILPTIDAPFAFPLAGAPPGDYTWLAAVTSTGTLTMAAPVASTPFTITP